MKFLINSLMCLVPALLCAQVSSAQSADLSAKARYRGICICHLADTQINIFRNDAMGDTDPDAGLVVVSPQKTPAQTSATPTVSIMVVGDQLVVKFATETLSIGATSTWQHEVFVLQGSTYVFQNRTDNLDCTAIPPSPSGFSTGN